MTAVDKRFSTIFCAVPAFIRVDPPIASSPVSTRIGCALAARSGVPALLAMPMVRAPRRLLSTSAAIVKGVVPLAATPITTS